MLRKLDDYPVLDEDHYSELEWYEAQEYWDQSSLRDRIEMCVSAGLSGFAARREMPYEVQEAIR